MKVTTFLTETSSDLMVKLRYANGTCTILVQTKTIRHGLDAGDVGRLASSWLFCSIPCDRNDTIYQISHRRRDLLLGGRHNRFACRNTAARPEAKMALGLETGRRS